MNKININTILMQSYLAPSASLTVGRCVGLERLIILAFRRWQQVLRGNKQLFTVLRRGVAIVYLKSGVGRREIVDSVKGQVSWRLWEERQGKGWFS